MAFITLWLSCHLEASLKFCTEELEKYMKFTALGCVQKLSKESDAHE